MTDRFVELADKTLGPDQKEMAKIWRNDYLATRAITDAKYIADAKLSIDPNKAALVFPYLDIDGNPTGFYRCRLPDGGFWQPEGSGNHLYMPPVKHKSLTMRKVIDDAAQPLVIAEGETRALVLNSRGIPCVAIGGIQNYRKDGRLIGDIERIPWAGRAVTLVYDHDVGIRADLQDAALDLARKLTDRGAEVKILTTPMVNNDPKTGADDFVANRGIREFKKLLNDAKSLHHPDFASWGRNGVKLDLSLSPIGQDWLNKKPPPLEFTWENYLPRGTVGLLVAEGGTGKTYFAQALAQSVAGGVPFLGLPTKQGIAVHIAFEEVPDELRRRQYAIYQNAVMDFPKSQLNAFTKALSQHLYIKSVVGQELHLAVMNGSNVVQGPILETLIYQLRQLGDVELVVIDPLSRAHSIDGESQAWGTTIINACERIAQGVGCTVLVTHHTGKGKEREDLYSSRGASALPDAARVVLRLKVATLDDVKYKSGIAPDDVANHRVLKLINAKLSYGPRVADTWLLRTPDGVLTPFVPTEKHSATFKGQLDQVYQFVKATGEEPFSQNLIKINRKEIFEDPKISEATAKRIVTRGIKQGSIIPVGEAKGGHNRLRFSESYETGGEI